MSDERPAKRAKPNMTEQDVQKLVMVSQCMDFWILDENAALLQKNRDLENQLARSQHQIHEFNRSVGALRRAANGALARSGELERMFEIQLDQNDQLHAYCQRLEERLREYEPNFSPEFEVIDLTADSDVDSDETELEDDYNRDL